LPRPPKLCHQPCDENGEFTPLGVLRNTPEPHGETGGGRVVHSVGRHTRLTSGHGRPSTEAGSSLPAMQWGALKEGRLGAAHPGFVKSVLQEFAYTATLSEPHGTAVGSLAMHTHSLNRYSLLATRYSLLATRYSLLRALKSSLSRALVAFVALPLAVDATGSAQIPIQLQPLVGSLATPGFVTSFPGNPDMIVVCERATGMIRSFDVSNAGGGPQPAPALVLDLSAEAYLPAPNAVGSDHGGLSGIAYHPKFDQGRAYRFMYVRFVRQSGPSSVQMVIRRYAIAMGTTVANIASSVDEFVYTMTNTAASNHTSGLLQFDPRSLASGPDDFYLYVPVPDASFGSAVLCECFNPSSPQPQHNTQRVQDDAYLEGKLIRIATLYSSGPNPVPLPVPFPEVVAKGLRHPYGFCIDPGHPSTGTGRGNIWIGDTGSDRPGDLHVFPAAGGPVCPGALCKNYGWPWQHGAPGTTSNTFAACGATSTCPPPQPFNSEAPYFAVAKPAGDNFGGGNGVLIGGVLYRGDALAGSPYNLGGRYFFPLWGDNNVHLMSLDPTQTTAAGIIASLMNHRNDLKMGTGSTLFNNQELHGIGVDAKGELLVLRVSLGLPSTSNGTVFRIVPQ